MACRDRWARQGKPCPTDHITPQHLAQHPQHPVAVGGGDRQRRLEADDVADRPADADEHAALAAGGAGGLRLGDRRLLRGAVGHQLDADHEPPAADVADERAALLQLPQALQQLLAPCRGVGGQALVVQHVERRHRRGTAHRVAPEGREVVAGREGVGDVGGGDERPERQAVGDALGHAHQVGLGVGVLDGEELARAAEPRLHLIADEQPAVAVDDVGHGLVVPLGRREDAALTQQALADERRHVAGGLVLDHVLDLLGTSQRALPVAQAAAVFVRRWREGDAREVRPAVFLAPRVAGDGQRPGRAAVEAVCQRDQLLLARVLLGQPHRPLERLGPAVAEESFLQLARRHRRQPLGQLRGHRRVVHVRAAVHQLIKLRLGRLDDPRVVVPAVHHRDPAETVEVPPAVRPNHFQPLGPLDRHRLESRHHRRDQVLVVQRRRIVIAHHRSLLLQPGRDASPPLRSTSHLRQAQRQLRVGRPRVAHRRAVRRRGDERPRPVPQVDRRIAGLERRPAFE